MVLLVPEIVVFAISRALILKLAVDPPTTVMVAVKLFVPFGSVLFAGMTARGALV